MKKIGLLVLAIVLAVGTLGIGYAAWTDTLYINGTVNTGEVNIDAEYFSGTKVYKEISTGATFEYMWLRDVNEQLVWENMTEPVEGPFFLVASAGSAPGVEDDHVDMIFSNLYPYNSVHGFGGLTADFIIHNSGTIPVKIEADISTQSLILAWLWDNDYVTVRAMRVGDTEGILNIPLQFGELIDDVVQLEPCDYIKVMLAIDLPQEDELEILGGRWPGGAPIVQEDFMNLVDLTFTGEIYAIQWNEYTPGWWD